MTKNAQYTREWLDIMENLDGDIAGRAAAHAYMETSTALVHYIQAESSFVPRLFDQETYNKMKWLAETAHRVCEKVMRRYLDDPSYRELFDYDERLRELILIPQRYDALLPFARFDVFL
ncbi:MAG: carboxylate--amine ligase, partial [Eggerthellaceae bacterium]|nr:carboxylate--amine ligase [Eggerthellaceae bacterium]